jgi:short subunit dehydrogenase-like uncharacterized protein
MRRTFDIVLFGATGFTGRLVAEYLATHAPAETRIALAGRNTTKLEQIRAGLPAGARAWPLLVADSGDAAAMQRLAEQTTVVCTTDGPYAKYGLPLVEACAKAGTHYCDLTGETQFMRDSIDRAMDTAKASGARIVHTCGFDSIPSDLGVLALHEALGKLLRVTYVVEVLKGGFSGGTVASALNGLDEAKVDKTRRRIMGDPYALSPKRDEEPKLGDERDLASFRFDEFTGKWVAPFIMASVNTRVVRRSNALLGYAYGRQFKYAEVMGMKNLVAAATFTAGLGLFMAGVLFGPTRKLVESRLPKPGEGPDEHSRKNGFLKVKIHAESEGGVKKVLTITGQGDPGYQLTSLILGQSALCLALDGDKLPKVAGVLTPATAMGRVLIDRLVAAGMTFSLD